MSTTSFHPFCVTEVSPFQKLLVLIRRKQHFNLKKRWIQKKLLQSIFVEHFKARALILISHGSKAKLLEPLKLFPRNSLQILIIFGAIVGLK